MRKAFGLADLPAVTLTSLFQTVAMFIMSVPHCISDRKWEKA